MPSLVFTTHPDVLIDPATPVPDWTLADRGRQRMRTFLANPLLPGLRSLWSSTERKAVEAAAILGGHLGLPIATLHSLGENDRSATGYLPRAEFEATADRFFAQPADSVRGWERAIDAQARIVAAISCVIAQPPSDGDIAVVAHGGVGTLLLCHIQGCAITRAWDQPANNGGNYFRFDIDTRTLQHGWRDISA